MSEWWTYRLYDFLLFTPRTYYRLFELYNAAVWPAQLVALAGGLALLVALTLASASPRGMAASRGARLLLAAAWLWVAIAFHAMRYATINWAAVFFAWAFGVEAVLLLVSLLLTFTARPRRGPDPPRDVPARIGIGLTLFAVVGMPLIGPLLGRPWTQTELFGLAPDPTAVGTLGSLVALRIRARWLLMIVPVLWCLLTGATLLAMGSRDFWIAPAAATIAVAAATVRARAAKRKTRAAPEL